MGLFDKNTPFIGVRIYDYFLEVWTRLDTTPTNTDLSTVNTLAAAAQTTANAAQTTANAAQTTANAAIPKAGGAFTGTVSFPSGACVISSAGITYEINNRVIRGNTTANCQGTYKATDNLLTIWRNNVAGIEQKIELPLTPTGTPKFKAVINGTGSATNSTGALIFDGTVINTGSNYNLANGRFTAPIAGIYEFTAHLHIASMSGANVTFRKNTVSFDPAFSPQQVTNNAMATCTTLVQLNTGDFIDVFLSAGSVSTQYTLNAFSGKLII